MFSPDAGPSRDGPHIQGQMLGPPGPSLKRGKPGILVDGIGKPGLAVEWLAVLSPHSQRRGAGDAWFFLRLLLDFSKA